jgi:predicted hotdog family 3-hydroxylacyl-ACP dehydratase
MILLDRVGELFSDGLQTFVDITEQSLFCETSGIPSYVGLEYMAQTVAAYAGYRALENSEKVKEGFLLGTREVVFAQAYFSIGSQLSISCHDFMSNHEMGVFDCEIRDLQQKTLLGSCKLNVFQPENPQAFFNRHD